MFVLLLIGDLCGIDLGQIRAPGGLCLRPGFPVMLGLLLFAGLCNIPKESNMGPFGWVYICINMQREEHCLT